MSNIKLVGSIHKLPDDFKLSLLNTPDALVTWNDITPLARDEYICLVTSGKKQQTRTNRINRVTNQLSEGTRRPCCWEGCPHRANK